MSIFSRLLGSGRRRKLLEQELDQEIQHHLLLRQEEYQRQGRPPREAYQEALQRFGDLESARSRLLQSALARDRRLHLVTAWENLLSDLKVALRKALKQPFFTALELTTVALAIAFTTGTFTLVDRVLLRPLPYPEPERLVALYSLDSSNHPIPSASSQNWHDWRQQNRSLAGTALVHSEQRLPILGKDRTAYATTRAVTGSFFEVLRPKLVHGRFFTETETLENSNLAVVSETFWRRFLRASERFPNRLRVSDRVVEVIGVVQSGQDYPTGTDLWLASRFPAQGDGTRNNLNFTAIARLREGVTRDQAEQDLSGIARRILETAPETAYSHGVSVKSLRQLVVGQEAPQTLWLLLAGSLFVLVVASANLAGLNLSRAKSELKETAVRISLGAGSPRLLQQLLTRHTVLALLGGAMGIFLAWGGTRYLAAESRIPLPRSAEIGLDARIALVGVALSILSGVLSGLIPALRLIHTPFRVALSSDAGRAWGHRDRTGQLLVAGELALCFLLVACSGLLVRNLHLLFDRNLGFDPSGVVAAEIRLGDQSYPEAADRLHFWNQIVEVLAARPEIESATLATWVPALGSAATFLEVEGLESDAGGAQYRIVGEDYFSALRIPLLAGRTFGSQDQAGSERVALVSRALADRYWQGQSAIGKRVRAVSMEQGLSDGAPAPWLRIIGITDDVRHWGFDSDTEPEVYTFYKQLPPLAMTLTTDMYLIVQSEYLTTAQLAASIQESVRELDRELAADPVDLAAEVEALMQDRQLLMFLISAFGTLAVALASLGVYGITSFSVSQRTREIGLRISVGASRSRIVALILGDVLRITVVGLLAGLAASWTMGSLLQSFLVEVGPGDVASHASALLVLLGVVLAAATLPAWRACRINPLKALRSD